MEKNKFKGDAMPKAVPLPGLRYHVVKKKRSIILTNLIYIPT